MHLESFSQLPLLFIILLSCLRFIPPDPRVLSSFIRLAGRSIHSVSPPLARCILLPIGRPATNHSSFVSSSSCSLAPSSPVLIAYFEQSFLFLRHRASPPSMASTDPFSKAVRREVFHSSFQYVADEATKQVSATP